MDTKWVFSNEWQINDDSVLVNTIDGVSAFVHIDQILLIGEYSNENGPFAEDHFIVLITENHTLFEIPACRLSNEDQEKLSTLLNSPINIELIFSTSFASRCIWPKSVEGRELLDFKRVFLLTMKLEVIDAVLAEAKRAERGERKS